MQHGVDDLFGDQLFRLLLVLSRMGDGDNRHLVTRPADRYTRNDHVVEVLGGQLPRAAARTLVPLRHVIRGVPGVARGAGRRRRRSGLSWGAWYPRHTSGGGIGLRWKEIAITLKLV